MKLLKGSTMHETCWNPQKKQPTLPTAGLLAASSEPKCTLALSYAMSMSDLALLEVPTSNTKFFLAPQLFLEMPSSIQTLATVLLLFLKFRTK